MMWRQRAICYSILTVTLVLAGCAAVPTGPLKRGSSLGTSDTDFASQMLPHHMQALELCALTSGRTSSAAVAEIAFRIDRKQVEEAAELEGFVRLQPEIPAAAVTTMPGMVDQNTIERLRSSSGVVFDRLWLQSMISHHEGAVTMAKAYLAGHPATLTEYARATILTQGAEIDQMRKMQP